MLPLNPRKKLQRKKRIKIGICINGKKNSILFSGRPVINNIPTCLRGEEMLPLIWHAHGDEYTKISHSILFQILYYGIHFQQKIRNKNSMGFKRMRISCRCVMAIQSQKSWFWETRDVSNSLRPENMVIFLLLVLHFGLFLSSQTS